jgi:hypothetical protein
MTAVFVSTFTAAALAVGLPIIPAPNSTALPPGATYGWAQPGAASTAIPNAQPPAWVSIATALPAPPSTSYAWAQPLVP